MKINQICKELLESLLFANTRLENVDGFVYKEIIKDLIDDLNQELQEEES